MWLLLTLLVFFSARAIAARVKHPLANPLLLSLLFLIPLLIFSEQSYEVYFNQTELLHFLLNFSVIALAYPLYENLSAIKQQWKMILVACIIASITSAGLGAGLAFLISGDLNIAATVLPKSISTPFALETSTTLGGYPSITSALVVIAGLFGAFVGYPILNKMRITSPIARGLTMGAISHAIGTAKANEKSLHEGAFSSLALVICGVLTAIFSPFMFDWVTNILN